MVANENSMPLAVVSKVAWQHFVVTMVLMLLK